MILGYGGTRQFGQLFSDVGSSLKKAWAECHDKGHLMGGFMACTQKAAKSITTASTKIFEGAVKGAKECFSMGRKVCSERVGEKIGEVAKQVGAAGKMILMGLPNQVKSYIENAKKAFSVDDKQWQQCEKLGEAGCAKMKEAERQLKLKAWNEGVKTYCGSTDDIKTTSTKARCGLIHINKWWAEKVVPKTNALYAKGINAAHLVDKFRKGVDQFKGTKFARWVGRVGDKIKKDASKLGDKIKLGYDKVKNGKFAKWLSQVLAKKTAPKAKTNVFTKIGDFFKKVFGKKDKKADTLTAPKSKGLTLTYADYMRGRDATLAKSKSGVSNLGVAGAGNARLGASAKVSSSFKPSKGGRTKA